MSYVKPEIRLSTNTNEMIFRPHVLVTKPIQHHNIPICLKDGTPMLFVLPEGFSYGLQGNKKMNAKEEDPIIGYTLPVALSDNGIQSPDQVAIVALVRDINAKCRAHLSLVSSKLYGR